MPGRSSAALLRRAASAARPAGAAVHPAEPAGRRFPERESALHAVPDVPRRRDEPVPRQPDRVLQSRELVHDGRQLQLRPASLHRRADQRQRLPHDDREQREPRTDFPRGDGARGAERQRQCHVQARLRSGSQEQIPIPLPVRAARVQHAKCTGQPALCPGRDGAQQHPAKHACDDLRPHTDS